MPQSSTFTSLATAGEGSFVITEKYFLEAAEGHGGTIPPYAGKFRDFEEATQLYSHFHLDIP